MIDLAAGDLVAEAADLEEPCDLLSFYVPGDGFFFEREGAGIVSRGAAATIHIPPGPGQVAEAARRAAALLGRIRSTGGAAPLIVGALPFDGSAPATLVVPQVVVVRRPDGPARRIVVGPDRESSTGSFDFGDPISIGAPEPPLLGSPLSVTPVPGHRSFLDSVAEARKRISDGDLEKVVLARMLMVRAEQPFNRRALLHQLRRREAGAYLFAVHGFLGASPELLVSRFGNQVRAAAIAGTIARPAGDPEAVARAAQLLLTSAKDRAEHALVVEAVCTGLEDVCESLDFSPEPTVLDLRNVAHLATEVTGTLRPPAPNALELAARLHPTPAVCGTPRDAALRIIKELEPIDRTLYAGIVGWMDASGDGEWAVALRCAEVQGRIALLFAGAGIVAASDPDAELAETDAKFKTMLTALSGTT
jgi:isochorismate synthase